MPRIGTPRVTLKDLAAIGDALGGLAVLATLLYLAYQFRQTTRIERTSAQRDLLKQARQWFELTLEPALFEVLRKGLKDWDALTSSEREQCSAWAFSFLFLAEQALYMRQEGLINDASFRGFMQAALAVVATPGGRVWWSSARNVLGDDISDHVDRELEQRPASAPNWDAILPHWHLD